jgi:LPXTG-site transpeptidase (sortase) family protein
VAVRLQRVLGALAVFAGAALLAGAAGQAAGARGAQAQAESDLVAAWAATGPPGAGLEARREARPEVQPEVRAGQPQPQPPEPPAFSQGQPLFLLEIPRIAVRNVVVYGSSDAALSRGPGLVERTALPGQPGNMVVAAHRDYYFWRLGELVVGDEIHLTTLDGSWTYAVTGRRVVKESDTEILEPTPTTTLTLFTCWPLIFAGRSPDRLVVTAIRKPERQVPQKVE